MDRNLRALAMGSKFDLSLSARRAWIEITLIGLAAINSTVALRKESVDRNLL